ncbi:hypothetical protein K8R30_03790 [archaeon]|nr:hypothetical protein [archaeon]
MVSLRVDVSKKDFVWIIPLVTILIIGISYAYGTSEPSVMGHSTGELELGPITLSGSDVGIGTTSPSQRLDVVGNIEANGNIRIPATAEPGRAIEIGTGRTENGYAYIDLIGDATYTDYGFRLIRNNNGANANSRIIHRGAGALQMMALESGPVWLGSDGSVDMAIISGGNVGIGTINPVARFEVAGGRVEFTANSDASGAVGSGTLEIANALRFDGNEIITNTGSTLYVQNDNNGDLQVDGSTFVVDASTNRVGIGTSSPSQKLDIVGNIEVDGICFKPMRLVRCYNSRSGDHMTWLNSEAECSGAGYNIEATRWILAQC